MNNNNNNNNNNLHESDLNTKFQPILINIVNVISIVFFKFFRLTQPPPSSWLNNTILTK